MKFTIKQLMLFTLVVALWLQTGIHGPMLHRQQLQQESDAFYASQTTTIDIPASPGSRLIESTMRTSFYEIRENRNGVMVDIGPGPWPGWSYPVLPLVLLTNAHQIEDLMNDRGQYKIIFYYGFGTVEIARFG